MRKKIMPFALAMMLGVSLLAGCGSSVTQTDTEEITEGQTEVVSQEETETEGETTQAETKSEETSASSDMATVEATVENPAKIGEWVETKTYAAEDSEYHTIYYKITDVIRGDEAQKIVDDYNSGSNVVVVNDLEQEDLEYCIVKYETYFPEDFPQAEYGIVSVDVDLSVCDIDGEGTIANYIGLSSVWDISKNPSEFHAGDTFKDGQAVFAMVKGHTEYLFESSYYENDTEVCTYVTGK